MDTCNKSHPSRRAFIAAGAGLAVTTALPFGVASAAAPRASGTREYRLAAAPGSTRLAGAEYPQTAVWAYNGQVPGTEIRVRQGDRVRISVDNRLAEDTTVHWHGLRVPNEMDGVPHLTQKPIAPGNNHTYEFDVPDAGTYWYHPHQRGFEQVARGLYGPLIVEEKDPIRVDRDLTWMLDDWRLGPDAGIRDDFGGFHDMSHSGRVGNLMTINGRQPDKLVVRSGERIRLRLINAANARIFALNFAGHRPMIVAYDGQPVTPHEAPEGQVVLGPAMRADIVMDMTNRPGESFAIADTFYRGMEYTVLDLNYGPTAFRDRPLDSSIALAANTMPEPDLAGAERHDVQFGGGMMGRMTQATMAGRAVSMRDMMRNGKAWAINGVAATGHVMDPLLTLVRGRTYILALDNDTAWHHPIHLHGHAFRVISRNGKPTQYREWQDTVLMAPRERTEIAFVADNPGDWMFHCHILEHQAGGMMGVIRVA